MSSFMTPIRTQSFASNNTTNSSTPIRMNSASSTSILTNRLPSADDSLYYICLRLMNSLAKVPGMIPYIELAYSQADSCAEQQALALSSLSSSSTSSSSSFHLQSQPTNNFSIDENHHNPNLYSSASSSQNNGHNNIKHKSFDSNTNENRLSSNSLNFHSLLHTWSSTLYTFASGLLPAQIAYDPVTPISKLLRQGTPLCLIFNALKPENSIDIVSSDDMKICKMNIYQFLSACKLHLNIRDDELFPVTMVFSDNTSHLLRVIHSVNFVLNLEPSFITPVVPDQIKVTDSRSKIVKELIETERRYVQDLETLVKYRNDLISSECLLSEDITMLFPNLTDIIEFQRRFLVGLECNGIVPSKYQRIGSVFIHAGVEGFKIYENWALLQSFAQDLIKREAPKLKNVSKVIKDPYDLLNFFLIKPIQRLVKYPLLLSQLLKETDPSWPNYNELHQAYLISKEVALVINESQRRAENIQHLNELKDKVVDWKGYNTRNVGDLLYFNVVTVKDLLTDGQSHEKEVHCYLFEKVIYFFKEVSSKNKILGSKKMSNSLTNAINNLNNSNSSVNNNSNSSNNLPIQLSLNGIVYISKIYKILPSEFSSYFNISQGHFLTLKWKGNKDTGGCIMKFRSEEHLKQWTNTIKRLSMDSNFDDMYAGHNSSKSISSISTNTSMLTNNTNRSSNTSSSTTNNSSNPNNRNSDRLRSSSDSTTFMKKLRSTSSSSFSNLSNISYPPLPTEKMRSLSITSQNTPIVVGKPDRKSSNTSSVFNSGIGSNSDEIASNLSSLTLSSNTGKMANIKLVFDSNKLTINLSVNSEIDYLTLIDILVKKMNYSMSSDNAFTTTNVNFKFKDEDGDFIRFQGDDDWTIAREMLDELDPDRRILELVAL